MLNQNQQLLLANRRALAACGLFIKLSNTGCKVFYIKELVGQVAKESKTNTELLSEAVGIAIAEKQKRNL